MFNVSVVLCSALFFGPSDQEAAFVHHSSSAREVILERAIAKTVDGLNIFKRLPTAMVLKSKHKLPDKIRLRRYKDGVRLLFDELVMFEGPIDRWHVRSEKERARLSFEANAVNLTIEKRAHALTKVRLSKNDKQMVLQIETVIEGEVLPRPFKLRVVYQCP